MNSIPPAPATCASLSPLGDLEMQHTLLSAFLSYVPDNVYFKDRESRFIAVSRSMARWVGYEPTELLGKTDFAFFDEIHARPAFEDEQRIIRTGEPIIDKLEKETWPDGRVTWVSTSKMPLRDEHGATIGTFGISTDVTEAKETEIALEKANRELVAASRMAGMAEVATSVLHNVGNVLNSLNVSAAVVTTGLRQSKVDSLAKVVALMKDHAADLGDFITRDPKGKLLPEFLEKLAGHFSVERTRQLAELDSLQKNIDHIKDIVSMQQAYAHMAGGVESLDPASLVEDAIRMNSAALARHDVQLLREFQPVPPVRAEKAKVLQILVNLIRNAKYALDEGAPPAKVMTLRLELGPPGWVRIMVADNGVGIPAENLERIFERGFTTRREGHGFGLSSAVSAARELRGSLLVHSDGPGKGATFTLQLPIAEEPVGTKK